MRIILVVGTRPNFMKIAPIWRELTQYPDQFEPLLLHTEQHYDDKMSQIFIDQLGLPEPCAARCRLYFKPKSSCRRYEESQMVCQKKGHTYHVSYRYFKLYEGFVLVGSSDPDSLTRVGFRLIIERLGQMLISKTLLGACAQRGS